jgi:uncharacterized membrane protein HdeD (DUF308 family)
MVTEWIQQARNELGQYQDVIEDCWRLFLGEAMVRIALGALFVIVPSYLPPTVLKEFYGSILLAAALALLVRSFYSRALPGFLPSLVDGVFTLVFSLVLLVYPPEPAINLRMVIVFYLLVEAMAQLIFASRFLMFQHAGGLFCCGLLALLFSMVISLNWPPAQYFWMSGLLLGLLYLLQGFIGMAMAMAMETFLNNLKDATPPATGDTVREVPNTAVTVEALSPRPITKAEAIGAWEPVSTAIVTS